MQKKLKMAVAVIIFVLLVIITFFLGRWVMSLRDPVMLADFQSRIASMGIGGWFLLLAIQYVQIVVAFIPGGPIQIVAGALFGPWGGLSVCLIGMLLATATIFYLVSRYGHSVISLFVDERDITEYKFLKDEKRLEILVLTLYFIPGTPKDALTYIFALTKIKMARFMMLSTIARIPAILTSIIAGNSIIEGRWRRALVMFIILTAVSAAGLLLHRFLRKKWRKEN